MSDDPRHKLGNQGEDLAAQHLVRLGYRLIARNHRTRFGELDIVAMCGETLVFCEVKTARGRGRPFDSLHDRKRAQVRRMAVAYLAEARRSESARQIRFDAIGVVIDADGRLTRLDHLEAAF
ncbi:MAG TPA: YraN family protein [Baekduia sp.]|nr:YraN family protein [Baekduia sp.]